MNLDTQRFSHGGDSYEEVPAGGRRAQGVRREFGDAHEYVIDALGRHLVSDGIDDVPARTGDRDRMPPELSLIGGH
ncbi:hypothetical protein Sm713_12990 [Streptomyces sp. TS71-3]|nr:hypothetical protein Sm713_12990 [Streptomyces sp. TS71-3]